MYGVHFNIVVYAGTNRVYAFDRCKRMRTASCDDSYREYRPGSYDGVLGTGMALCLCPSGKDPLPVIFMRFCRMCGLSSKVSYPSEAGLVR